MGVAVGKSRLCSDWWAGSGNASDHLDEWNWRKTSILEEDFVAKCTMLNVG